MDLQLAGLRALVTGGTKGIGRAIVEGLVAEGASVAFCARTESDVEGAVAELTDQGANVVGGAVDVGNGPSLAAWVRDAAGSLGGLDIVVTNVSALAIGSSEENWQTSFDVDMMHTVRTVEAAMPFLEESASPSITVVSSVSAREIDFAAAAYGSMKAALVHYAQAQAYLLAGKGIRVNSICAGNTFFEGGVWHRIQGSDPDLFRDALSLNPTGRMAKPEEIAYAVVMLSSPRASFVTGTNVVVDGALTRGVQL
jgi:NAD(P)-dependent dehydrogenase (short-subunit alcohol dehydrogenase family)